MRIGWLVAVALTLVTTIQAYADVVTYRIDFNSPGFTQTGTAFPVSGSFTVTLDRSKDTPTDNGQNVFVTKDFAVNSFSYMFSQPVSVGYAYAATYGELYVVASPDLGDNPYNQPGFTLDFYDINSNAPYYSDAGPVLVDSRIVDLAHGVNEDLGTRDVTVTQLDLAPTPEPSAWLLMSTGALALCVGARRRLISA